ncbi:symmetrical bis(5'-nucleosyl)-tetraphosphatase [Alteromonas sp. ASW11-130]|uniref:symmetrical bis(5'-nucleosyl)-tetraphosphatase n=1 Tax=Alteromonas sp. ASW11-130 TaxID=3015775 RepID=UPI002241EFC2|nr:symmetrical bis(5'-nucleosyl)-tetraphosphatase [Alteromonas sp. ASW11-130]MCW8090483.1 symmetrical bis(5'-nucleosyl)-tetraphosphatase [Alteromonas sp. ASW11-130]
MARQSLVVGDIQGCLAGLLKLLQKADFDPQQDRLYAVGDLIGRGSDSLGTAEYLMSLGDNFQAVLGNHDLNFLAVSQGFKQARKSDRLEPLLNSIKLPDIVHWLRQFPLAQKINNSFVMVHAGLYPFWSVDELMGFSSEISEILRGKQWQSLLNNMYGHEPRIWSANLEDMPRNRFIINACTRMRYLNSENQLDFENSGHPDDAPDYLTPWFEVEKQRTLTHKVIFGHWASLNGLSSSKHFIGLDTGYVWGQKMTALRVETLDYISVSAD